MFKIGLAFFSCTVKKVKMKFVDIVLYHEFKEKTFMSATRSFLEHPCY